MTGVTLLISLLVSQADAQAIADAWEVREINLKSVEVSWTATRNSRDQSFGFENASHSERPSTFRISGQRIRQDGERLTTAMRDGRTRPAESDPEKARRQFRHVLLEERLAGIQTTPFEEAISSVSTIGGAGPSRRFGLIEQMLFDVPAACARPLNLFPGRTVIIDEKTSRPSHHICLSPKLLVGQDRTVWIEPAEPYRLLRVIDVDPDRGTTQVDLEYGNPDELFPSSWTVQQLNSAGMPLDFATARRRSLSINPVIEDSVFQLPIQMSSDDVASLSPLARTMRRFLRAAIDSSWHLLVVAWGLIVIAMLRSRRTNRSGSDVETPRSTAQTKRLAIGAAIATPVIAILPLLPLGDPSMQEACQRLETIRRQSVHLEDSNPTEANAIRDESLRELKGLSAELRSANEHRSGLWRVIRKSEPQDEAAWRDIQRVADSELPASIRSTGSTNDIRKRAVRLTLEKVDEHLAGVHPYMPPPKPVLIQTGLDVARKPDVLAQTSRSAIILALEIGVAVSAWWIWRIRRRRRLSVRLDCTDSTVPP